ncbi:uncharacterized protein A4U43_C09F8930 [Asparagus officinalis]|uniref:Glycoside hydrolase family 5 domain-containing protein n=1 Tax=Asparagus officinalis TaxID=4686 RepID=A0A5P1E6T8_ASPOF|nr:uncharacterized protein LOC109824802 [Asparagus officinalis]ONK58169.1 uncharacterized protein A4U43_C09F8930 [Asparagus officinalis]
MKLSLLHTSPALLLFIILFQTLNPQPTSGFLSTSDRWIVNESGQRVKLACANWPSHLAPVVAEGLSKSPLDAISKLIGSMGFNCVRLTWPLYLVTNSSYATLTVRQSFQGLGLNVSLDGLTKNNAWILDKTLIEAYKAVVANLGSNNIMVILDNHLTQPGWCCNNNDGNGFFWDPFFNPNEWLAGLSRMARLFNGVTNVVGMSLRNELRGPRQNVPDWYKYMPMGADAVHQANPNVLVILSGLNFDNDLSFLSKKKLKLSFPNKLVHEVHWYAFSNTDTWSNQNANDACGSITSNIMRKAGFVLSQGTPLFMSEWGIDQRGGNRNDNRYSSCALAALAELDLDWALWALQGSYYLREGVLDMEEVYGAMNLDWSGPRNATFLHRLASIKSPFRGPGLNNPLNTVLYHPKTGSCVVQDGSTNSSLHLGPCDSPRGWKYNGQTIQLVNSDSFLKESGAGQPVTLENFANSGSFKWDLISNSKLHITSQTNLCLDIGSDGSTLITNPCNCIGKDKNCDPEGQWFKMVPSNRPVQQ